MIFSDPRFWLAVSFFIFLTLVAKYLMPKIIESLDNKSQQILNQIKIAEQSRQKAEQLLLEAQKHHEESLIYCAKLIEDAKSEASELLTYSQKLLAEELDKKTNLTKERIATDEEKTMRDIKSEIINAAIKIIETKAANFNNNSATILSKKAITNISKIIH